jgi:ABC-type glycerol-3-phosphate transport system permease component
VLLILGLGFLVMAFYNYIFLVLGVFILVFPYLYIFVKSVENSCLTKMKSWKELSEGDWLVQSIKINKKMIKPSADGLSKEDINLIKKSGKKVLIKDGLPFVPVFLISLIVSLIVGNLLIRILEILI